MHSSVCLFLPLLLALLTLSSISKALVPAKNRFKFVNNPNINGEYAVEYTATYTPTSLTTRSNPGPFGLAFYNTTPGAYTFGLLFGSSDPRNIYHGNKFYVRRWVWEANRGKPVGAWATFALLANGNLVIKEADGRVAWQTNTANEDVVGLDLLPNGNLVLYNSKGDYVWQSFDSATDTLVIGQGLKLGGTTKLVSRASETDNSAGPYSLEMERETLVLYYTSPTSGKRYPYYSFADRFISAFGHLKTVTFQSAPRTGEYSEVEIVAYSLFFNYTTMDLDSFSGNSFLTRPNYNVTYSMLRLGIDGSLKVITFYWPVERTKYQVTFNLFSPEGFESECQMPEKCGKLGLCKDNMCVGCPTDTGSTEWSSSCRPPKTVSALACANKAFKFNKLVGVDHFMSAYTQGENVTEGACGSKCTSDCKCAGYFYHQLESKCWVAYDLNTLTRNGNSTHIGYIKVPK